MIASLLVLFAIGTFNLEPVQGLLFTGLGNSGVGNSGVGNSVVGSSGAVCVVQAVNQASLSCVQNCQFSQRVACANQALTNVGYQRICNRGTANQTNVCYFCTTAQINTCVTTTPLTNFQVLSTAEIACIGQTCRSDLVFWFIRAGSNSAFNPFASLG